MLLRNFLPKFSLLESACGTRSVLVRSIENRKLYLKFVQKMGCSTSKRLKIEQVNETKKRSLSMPPEEDEFVEGVVCQDSDIKENEMKAFELHDAGKVLILRQKGKLSAIGTKCTHYGAPLVKSALGDGRVRCQWHGACFNISTGDIEDFPGLDSLPCYQITVENNFVKVRARRSELETNKRIKTMAKRDPKSLDHFIVIGGGPSGAICVETLRQEGFRGKITLVARERYLPYDRIKVNKTMDVEMSTIQLRMPEFYAEHGIDVLTGCAATGIDTENKQVKLYDGSFIRYDAVYIATGSAARKANIPGADLKNVIVLREYDHAVYTESILSPDKHVVVLGSSFIGMEAAAYCVSKVAKVTVVSKDSVPFEASLGPEVGAGVLKMFQNKKVNFVPQSGLTRCIDNGIGEVGSVELLDGTVLKADICIMGVGSTLNTEFLKDSGVAINNDGSVEVDEYLRTNVCNIYAGGDIAHAPVWARDNMKAAIGHYGLAQYHGQMAARNMLKQEAPLKAIPFFWTMLFGTPIRYAGHGRYDDVIYHGNPGELKFVAFYLKGDEVIAISDAGNDPIVSIYAERIALGKKLYRKDLEGDPLAWSK